MSPNFKRELSLKKIVVVAALSLWAMASYAAGEQDHSKMNHGKMEKAKMNKSGRKMLSAESKKSVINVLKVNEELHNSFFKNDVKSVEINAQKLKKAIESIKDKEIAKLLKFSIIKLGEIKASNDRESNNQNYHLVSMALIHLINTYDVGGTYNAYSCPMVKKKWIQNSEKISTIHNPYASNMPHCGSQDSHL